jgi:hypothetical protein
MMTLRGIGQDDRTVSEAGSTAMHYRRETTERERDYVFKTQAGRIASRKHQTATFVPEGTVQKDIPPGISD